MKLERMFTMASLLAAGVVVATACTTSEESVDTTPDPDGGIAGAGGAGGSGGSGGSAGMAGAGASGGAGGGSGGAAGAAGAGGTAGAGGRAGAGGMSGAAGSGGGVGECFGDMPNADAPPSCTTLPYWNEDCGGEVPLGQQLCVLLQDGGRAEIFEEVHACLSMITPDDGACSAAHEIAVLGTEDDPQTNVGCLGLLGSSCDTGPVTLDGDAGVYDCEDVAASCTDVPLDACEGTVDSFDDDARKDIFQCYVNGFGECAADFEDCALPFDFPPTACLGDATRAPADFPPDCMDLDGADADCGGGAKPVHLQLCERLTETDSMGNPVMREGVAEDLYGCLEDITETDVCGIAHEDAVIDCIATETGPRVCDRTNVDCPAEAAVTCSDSTDQLDENGCNTTLAGFTNEGAASVLTCATTGCESDFFDCAYGIEFNN